MIAEKISLHFRELKNAIYSHKYQKKKIVEKYLGHQIIKMNRFYIANEELSKTNGLCDVWRHVAEYLVISIYYCFCVSGMMEIIAGAEFYDSSNKLLSIIPWGLPNIHTLLYFCV